MYNPQSGPLCLYGTHFAARALALLHWYNLCQKHVVVVCPTADFAQKLSNDLNVVSRCVLGVSIPVYVFSEFETSPYSTVAPSIKIRLNRIAILSRLAGKHSSAIILTTLAAAQQTTLPPNVLLEYYKTLSAGDTVSSRADLLRWLQEAGYLRVETVEDPGTFAARGEILDLFPPQEARPVRIEFFDLSIEKIRPFDPATQRAETNSAFFLESICVPPSREVLINNNTWQGLRARLKRCADDTGIPRKLRDPVLESIQSGLYPEYSDLWSAFAYETPAILWDYLKNYSSWVWLDRTTCLQEWSEYLESQRQRCERAHQTGHIVPPPAAFYDSELRFESAIQICLEPLMISNNADSGPPENQYSLETVPLPKFLDPATHRLGQIDSIFDRWLEEKKTIYVFATPKSQLDRIRYLLEEHKIFINKIHFCAGFLSSGALLPSEKMVWISDQDLLGRQPLRSQHSASNQDLASKHWSGITALSDLSIQDAIVHRDHGIGKYLGLVRLNLSGAPSDFLLVEYANRDKLYLPVYRLNVIQKYVGSGDQLVLDRLGISNFQKTKERVRGAVKSLAIDLLKLYAERKARSGYRCSGRDSSLREFEAQFPFEETIDQEQTIDDILKDLQSGVVMDRLVCGDVGYGKTEIAMRAAFCLVSEGKQVAVLVPTTVLALQHEQSFRTRFENFPIHIESLSRFRKPKEQKEILTRLTEGKIDILIGTHRLLSKDVHFRDLGLLVVDEEHRFGVEHKEKLKALRLDTHVLTLTATPIPRTLHMTLSGLREISLIRTPPINRLPIRTFISKFDEELIRRAIETELSRGGQVFFLHNRVQDIHRIAEKIQALVPHAKILIGHGQMSATALEKTMVSFYQREADILVCTAIIESGLDIPSANTILINRADTFGLAQLYQIRGRVGRSQQRAYAYLLIPNEERITSDAKARLEVLQKYVELGSGFQVAHHDLELRGGGDLLGPQQSGHIASVGFDLYTELLEEAIREIQGKPLPPSSSLREPEIKIPFPAFLDEQYIPDIHHRLSIYRRFSVSRDERELLDLEEELRDRFGPLPEEAQNLLWLIRIKQLLKSAGVDSLSVGKEKISFSANFPEGAPAPLNPNRAIALVASDPAQYQLTPDSRFVVALGVTDLKQLLFSLEAVFKTLQGG